MKTTLSTKYGTQLLGRSLEAQVERLNHDWTCIAGEPVEVEVIRGTFYGYCSELGTLRLLKFYRYCGERADAKFSPTKAKFYFRLETNF